MDDLYSIPVTSNPKLGLGLLASDLETFQFPTLCEGLSHEQILALDDNQSFYLAFPDAGIFGTCDEVVSRTSTAVTPQSECSTRTALSTTNISPTSDILSSHDKPTSQDVDVMYHDATQSVISSRQSRAASVTWPATNGNLTGLSSNLTPPMRPVPRRPQSFSYRLQHMPQLDNQTPPPSSFFSSPNMQPQTLSSRSLFLTPNIQSPLMPQLSQLPTQNAFLQSTLTTNTSSYYGQPQELTPTTSHQQLQRQYQQQLQFQQQQTLVHRRSLPPQPQNHAQMSALFPQHHQVPSQTQTMQSYNSNTASNSTISGPSSSSVNTPSLPNTTGNSSTGYQCFSHGCGGRHFSNWGNLVRHHRERQLRSKAGAKPMCPRCGKGFTRSSARDAHVAGLKCVLGRRRRVATDDTGAAPGATSNGSSKGEQSPGVDIYGEDNGRLGRRDHYTMPDGDLNHDHDDGNDNGSEGSREDVDAREGDEVEMLGERSIGYGGDEDVLVNAMRLGGGGGPAYLASQHLQFQH